MKSPRTVQTNGSTISKDAASVLPLRSQCKRLLAAPDDLNIFLRTLWNPSSPDPLRSLANTMCSNCPPSWRACIVPLVDSLRERTDTTGFDGFAAAVRILLKSIASGTEMGSPETKRRGIASGAPKRARKYRSLDGPLTQRTVSVLFHQQYHTIHGAWQACLTRSHRKTRTVGRIDREGLHHGICSAAGVHETSSEVTDYCAAVLEDTMEYATFCRLFSVNSACQSMHRRTGELAKHFSLDKNALVLQPPAEVPGTVLAWGKRNPEGRYTGQDLLSTLQDAATHLPRAILVMALRSGLMAEIEARLVSARSKRFPFEIDTQVGSNDQADVEEELLIEYTDYLEYAWDVEDTVTNLGSSSVITQILAFVNRSAPRLAIMNVIETMCDKSAKEPHPTELDGPSSKANCSSMYTTRQLYSICSAIEAYQRKGSTFVSYEDIPNTTVNKQLLWRRARVRRQRVTHKDAGRMPFMPDKSGFGRPEESRRLSTNTHGHKTGSVQPRAHRHGTTHLYKSKTHIAPSPDQEELLPDDVAHGRATDRSTVYFSPLHSQKKKTERLMCDKCGGKDHSGTWPHVDKETHATKCVLCDGRGHQSITCPLRAENRCSFCLGRLELTVWYEEKPSDIEVAAKRVVSVNHHGYSHELGVLVGYSVVLPERFPAWVTFHTGHLDGCHPEVDQAILREPESSIPISTVCWKLDGEQRLFLGGHHVIPWDSKIWDLEIYVRKLARTFRTQNIFLREEKECVALSRIDRIARRLRCEYMDYRYLESDITIDEANIVTELRNNGQAKKRGVEEGMEARLACKRDFRGTPIGEIIVDFKLANASCAESEESKRATLPPQEVPDFDRFLETQVALFGAKEKKMDDTFIAVPRLPNTTQKFVLKYDSVKNLLEGYSKAKTMLPIVDKVNRFHRPTATGYRDLVLVTEGNYAIHFVPAIIFHCWKHAQGELKELRDDATIILNKARGEHFFDELLMSQVDERLGMCEICEGVGHWQGNCPSVPRVDFRPLLQIHEELEVADLLD